MSKQLIDIFKIQRSLGTVIDDGIDESESGRFLIYNKDRTVAFEVSRSEQDYSSWFMYGENKIYVRAVYDYNSGMLVNKMSKFQNLDW